MLYEVITSFAVPEPEALRPGFAETPIEQIVQANLPGAGNPGHAALQTAQIDAHRVGPRGQAQQMTRIISYNFV